MTKSSASGLAEGTDEVEIGGAKIRIGDSAMRSLFDVVRRLAVVRLPILVHGESGAGKELVARALHANAPWRNGPFVPINCGALPAGLVESELFGHERGAFSGAAETKLGLFETAGGGTLSSTRSASCLSSFRLDFFAF